MNWEGIRKLQKFKKGDRVRLTKEALEHLSKTKQFEAIVSGYYYDGSTVVRIKRKSEKGTWWYMYIHQDFLEKVKE